MPRQFTQASSEYLEFGVGSMTGFDWSTFTVATICRRTVDSSSQTILSTGTSGGTETGQLSMTAGNHLQLFVPGQPLGTGAANVWDAHNWQLLVASKTSGTNPLRMLQVILDTGTVTHETTANSVANASAIGSGGKWSIGREVGSAEYANGPFAMTGVWTRNMSDSERLRLVSGNWALWEPDLLIEFGPRDTVISVRANGRQGAVQTVRSGTSRALDKGPAGVRYSMLTRRR